MVTTTNPVLSVFVLCLFTYLALLPPTFNICFFNITIHFYNRFTYYSKQVFPTYPTESELYISGVYDIIKIIFLYLSYISP